MTALRHIHRAGSGRALALLVCLTFLVPALRADEQHLDRQLQKYAKEINDKLRRKYLRGGKETVNVGVLKFLAQRGKGGPLMDNAGTINLALADRLEVALALANPDEKLGVIDHASQVIAASGNKRANHLTPKGRAAIFEIDAKSKKYPLAWGSNKVQADLFLTGTITFSSDFTKVTVTVQSFDRTMQELEEVCTFTAWADPRTLQEAGESFVIPKDARGTGFDMPFKHKDQLALAAQARRIFVAAAAPDEVQRIWRTPVEVTVLYDDRAVPITWEQGSGWRVRTPKEGQSVKFRLRNVSDRRVGVLLAVNGVNTADYQQVGDPASMSKWILDKGSDPITVSGFQKDDGKADTLTVLPPEQSERDFVKYGDHAGTFMFAVYYEGPDGGAAADTDDDNRLNAIAHGRGVFLGGNRKKRKQFFDLKDLQSQLKTAKGAGGTGAKGLLVPGAESTSKIREVDFKVDPSSGVRGTIFYYKPGDE